MITMSFSFPSKKYNLIGSLYLSLAFYFLIRYDMQYPGYRGAKPAVKWVGVG